MTIAKVVCKGIPRRGLQVLVAVLAIAAGPAARAVVIHEIHYNPEAGGALEYIELHNASNSAVSLEGWGFVDGVSFTFGADASLEPGEYLLVCKDRGAAVGAFELDPARVFGNFEGSLANGGERLSLADPGGTVVDSVRYDDDPPWGTAADGTGASLQRICSDFTAEHPGNWSGDTSAQPTPLAPNVAQGCPPPELPPPVVGINEIHYHPFNDRDDTEEFIELRNNSAESIDLDGWSFSQGIDFKFEGPTPLEPGGLIVVARNREDIVTRLQIENVVGDFTGQLSNSGERITLVDTDERFVDSVRYRDGGDWPVSADGLGYSLEKILPEAVTDDAMSWTEAAEIEGDEWHTVTLLGDSVSTSSLLRIYISEPGEFLIDNLVIEAVAEPGVNLIPNGGFDEGTTPWEFRGSHETSEWVADGGADGGPAIRLISTGRGSSTNAMRWSMEPALVKGESYRMTFDYKHVRDSIALNVRLSGATPTRGIFFQLGSGTVYSPGAPNSRRVDHLPPFVDRIGRWPQEPTAADETWITARVRAERSLESVRLAYRIDESGADEAVVEMADDGVHRDGVAGDGIWGASVPAQPHNTIVLFHIIAEDETGANVSTPLETDPTGFHGFYVNDNQPDSPLPVYTLLWNHRTAISPRTMRSRLASCAVYVNAAFAYQGDLYFNIGLRRRGGSVCGDGNVIKPYMKVKFNRGRLFGEQRKVNLQSYYTDKALIREVMSWQTFEEFGFPTCKDSFIRLHLNGSYFGLYGELEHLDGRYLARNGLNPDGNLYKATASREEANGTYEKKTNEHIRDMDDLRDFLSSMHATRRNDLPTFFHDRMDEDRVIDYQLVHTLTNNSDYPHKNHYLYHDTEKAKWMVLGWDMDLTFGKRWDGGNGGVLHDRMHTPGNNPWYTTSVDGGLGNHLLDKFFSQGGTWYRRSYITRLWDALQERYTNEFYNEKINAFHALLIDEQADDIAVWGRSRTWPDDPSAPAEFEPNLLRIRQHVNARRNYLESYLRSRHQFTGHDRVRITEVMYNPTGTEESLEWIELWNSGETEIDFSGWSIEGVGFVAGEDTVIGAGEIFIVAKDPAAFEAEYGNATRVLGGYEGKLDNNGEILRLKDSGPEYPATVDFLRFGTDGDWPRPADGLGYSLELTDVHADRDNDFAIAWRASGELGGSPGVVEGINVALNRYRRGDVDADGKLNVSDAIVVLRHLFAGLSEPPCAAAMDVDASGTVQSTDALLILGYLFGSEETSFPAPGPDDCAPVDEAACRESNCGD